ncbi:MAG TPA: hypothetical protein VEW46_25240 [Pyrinomonadaceae bacterium]|nr:hypothetical protein [Pyrinomonadaceae bacterium]
MKKLFFSLAVIAVAALGVFAQGDAKPVASIPVVAVTATTLPSDLAKAALAAQGGEKFKSMKSLVLRGSVDLYAPNSTQSIPGGFMIVTAGDKVRVEIDARPAVSFKQVFDGQQSYSSLPGVEMAPFNRIGLALLSRYDQTGITVTAIPDKKKQRGFRIADADGYTTDFYIDPATGRVMSFIVPLQGQTFGVENKKFKEVDGVLVPSSFTWRMEMPQGAFFADYNVKDMKLNNAIGDDVFVIPN